MMTRQYKHKPRKECGRFISLGAGVQSSALVEMYIQGDLSADQPLDAVIFADTGDEPEWVYQQVNYLSERLKSTGTPLVIVSTGNMVEDMQSQTIRFATMPLWVVGKDGKPAMLRRQCTREYKIQPIRDHLLAWLVERDYAQLVNRPGYPTNRRVKPGVLVTQYIGISLDEFLRACQSERDPAWVKSDWPLLEKRMRREDCISYLQERGLRVPKKSSCKRCPYHDNLYWQALPAGDFAEVCVWDDWLRTPAGRERLKIRELAYVHRSCKPLREVNLSTGSRADVEPCQHCMT